MPASIWAGNIVQFVGANRTLGVRRSVCSHGLQLLDVNFGLRAAVLYKQAMEALFYKKRRQKYVLLIPKRNKVLNSRCRNVQQPTLMPALVLRHNQPKKQRNVTASCTVFAAMLVFSVLQG